MKKSHSSDIGNLQSLRVLIIEDSEDDVLLVIRELKKGGYHPDYERIETAPEMIKALREKQWDIILCDYNLPKFSAPSAINLLKDENADIPLIVISGTISEEKAVECMRSGAHDYIMKGSYSRLCPAIDRELEEAKSKQDKNRAEAQKKDALEKLRDSEERYRKINNCIPDLIWSMDLSGRFTFANEAVMRTHGWTADEYVKLSFADLVSPQQAAKNFALLAEELAKTSDPAYDRNAKITYESEELRKDGSSFWAEVTATFLWSEDGKPNGVIGITRDNTERKKAREALQESEELKTRLVNAMPDVVVHTDLEGSILFVNDNAVQIGGYSKEEFLGQNLLKFVAPEEHKLVLKNIQLMRDVKLGPREYHLMIKDGRKVPFEINGDILRLEDGTPFAVVHICRDVTERKRTEKFLRERDERLRGITENLPGVIFQFYAKDDGEYGNLRGNEIIPEARILAVADVVEAMASHRPYRASLGIESALTEIETNKGILYDEAVVNACIRLFMDKGYVLT
ncbi:MAG: PAS domain S-box protein [Smithella sp.]